MNRLTTIRSYKIDCSDRSGFDQDYAGDVSATPPSNGIPFVSGRSQELQLQPDLSLYASDVCDEQDVEVSGILQPGLLVVLPLAGEADVTYGDQRFLLGNRDNEGNGLVLSLTQRDRFSRRLIRGTRRRVVSLAFGSRWLSKHEDLLAAYPVLESLRGNHLAVQHWRLSAHLRLLAGSVFELCAVNTPLMGLRLESRCLDIVAEVLAGLTDVNPASERTLRPRERRRLAEFRAFLDSGAGDDWSMQALAERIGMSPSTLQRYFRLYTGNSVFAYQRRRLLEQARIALEQEGISVSDAAQLAGYTSAANFATAFRRQFGMQPGILRLHR
ncbi:helix-turn-helix transcriptional regulator [Methylomonas albis]|uniref:Helix-turn-helix transcriptional regulator n=1 Tax=Methylomonas albis TaxID=1854563 RepID=A0ABR9CZ16_9GAMM|nr:AraC family transcriptional regulator [Methylomonas albis]MBD9356119.1 helix-turn-helix transcriptional regulator [Methylomonas albis]